MQIDSHHHFWIYAAEEYPWISAAMDCLRKSFLPEDLRKQIQAASIDQVISVQARQSLAETRWLLKLAEQHDFIAGVVGWVPLGEAAVVAELEQLASAGKLKGVRHVVQDEPDPEFILGEQFNRGVASLLDFELIYDILIFGRQLGPTIRFVDRHPRQTFVLDHIAKPTIRTGNLDEQWSRDIRELAKRPNVWCKFSGVVTEVREPDWSLATLEPYWQVALEAFGPQRLMFGSDWPVCLLKTSYLDWISTVKHLTSQLSSYEQQAFWGGNAQTAYRL